MIAKTVGACIVLCYTPATNDSRIRKEALSVTMQTLDQRIEITPDVAGGRPRVAGRRITVQNIALWHEWMGRTVDEISSEHDLALADVYAALAYSPRAAIASLRALIDPAWRPRAHTYRRLLAELPGM